MRQFMAHLLWEFEMELIPEAEVWTKQKTGLFPYRGPLYVNIKSRNTLAITLNDELKNDSQLKRWSSA